MKCPRWFTYIGCVIIQNPEGKFLLGLRKKGQAEAEKWGLLGGVGAFGESRSRSDFLIREIAYDINLRMNPSRLKASRFRIVGDGHHCRVEDYCSYQYDPVKDDPVEITGNEMGPTEIKWSSFTEIEKMHREGKIAFDDAIMIGKFLLDSQN